MGAADLLLQVRLAGFTLNLADGKLLVTPASMLTDELRAALRACKPAVLALLAAEQAADVEAFEERAAIIEFDGGLSRADAEVAARQCVDCEHFGRRRTCLEPVAAGLLTGQEGFGIVWAPDGHAARCAAFTGTTPTPAQERPYKLTREHLGAAHADAWDEADIGRFQARVAAVQRRGFGIQDAEDLAERQTLRDRQADDRHMCLECRDLESTGRCAAARRGGIHGADRRMEPVQTILMRCHVFQPTLRARANQEGTDDADHHG